MFYRDAEDEAHMRAALELARRAAALGEVPVGAVVVREGKIIGEGYNQRELLHSPLAHGEILAIEQACRAVGDWRLTGCSLYVTLEPCPMCAGAILNARLRRLVYGAADLKGGCCGSLMNLMALDFPIRPSVTAGVLAGECTQVLEDFFQGLRE